MRTVVLFPTAGEAEAFRRRCPGVAYRITGVGPAAAAAATARAIVDERPDLLLLAGIAGVYPASEVAVGEVVAVAEERVEGLPERYADAYRPTFAVPGLRTAVSNSVARSGAAPAGAEVENMEGAAFLRRRCGAGRTGRRGACRLQPRGRTLRRVARSRCLRGAGTGVGAARRRNRIRLFAGLTSLSPIRRGCRKGVINLKFKPIGL